MSLPDRGCISHKSYSFAKNLFIGYVNEVEECKKMEREKQKHSKQCIFLKTGFASRQVSEKKYYKKLFT
jgi:hypothetical protein